MIDCLVVVNDLNAIDDMNPAFEKQSYCCMGEFGMPGRRYYRKGKTTRTHHIHLFEQGHPDIARHLAFRDYLNKHPDIASGYSWIKRCLAKQFPTDINAYMHGKDSFIRMIDYQTGNAIEEQLSATDEIVIVDHDPNWEKLAAAELCAIKQTIALPHIAIEHLGSSAVAGLSAKPIIDIFIALDNIKEAVKWIKPLAALGYDYWADNPEKNHYRFFKGMPPFGLGRTHHAHILPMGEDFKRRVAFRNLLRSDANIRDEYQQLKLRLAAENPEDREAYTEAKKVFIDRALPD